MNLSIKTLLSLVVGGCLLPSVASVYAATSVTLTGSSGDSDVKLSWSDPGSGSKFQIYQDTDSNPSGRSRIAKLSSSMHSFTATGLQNGKTYYFWVKYTDSDGNTANSAYFSATPQSGASTPTKSVTLSGSSADSEVKLSWSDPGTGSTYQIYQDTDSNPSGRKRIAALPSSTLSYTATGLQNGKTYYYWVKYTRSDGTSANSSAFSATPQASASSTSDSADVNASCGVLGSDLAWGTNGDSSAAPYLDFISTWVGYEYGQDRAYQCDGCGMVSKFASSSTYVAYYAYFAGFALPDCNVQPEGGNLCTNGAEWIRNNYDYLISLYADYAAKTYAADPNKGVLWLLEGDFHQYSTASQSQPLSLKELGKLAADISQAIKSNAPNAKVAINHSTWISNEETNAFWKAMPLSSIDFVWTTGVGNNNGYFNSDANSSTYNGATARYDYLSSLTGKKILVDTSFGLSQAADSWTGVAASEINARIAEGVFAINVTKPPSDYQSRLANIQPQLNATCKK